MADRISYGPFTLYESEAYKQQKELDRRAREMQVRKLEMELSPELQLKQQTSLAEASAAQGFNPEATPAAQAVGQRIYGQAVGMQKIPGTTLEVPVGTPPSMMGSLLQNSVSNIKELRVMAEMAQDPVDKKIYSNLADSAEKGLNAKAKDLSAADLAFESNASAALRYADQFENVVKKYGTFESQFPGSPEGSALLGQLPYQMAIAYAKVVDPASVAREGEVAAAQKYIIPTGMLTRNDTALAAISNFRNDILNRASEYSRISGRQIEMKKPIEYTKQDKQQEYQQQQPTKLQIDPTTGKIIPPR